MSATKHANKYDTHTTEKITRSSTRQDSLQALSLLKIPIFRGLCNLILYHGKRHPVDMGAAEVEAFLTYLATQRQVSSSTQNQALSEITGVVVNLNITLL